MKPIIEKENQDTILTSEITSKHIVVGVDEDDNPLILTRENFVKGNFCFRYLVREFINGNGVEDFNTIKGAIEYEIAKDSKIEVFNQEDWKEALQWLLDNA